MMPLHRVERAPKLAADSMTTMTMMIMLEVLLVLLRAMLLDVDAIKETEGETTTTLRTTDHHLHASNVASLESRMCSKGLD